MNTSGSYIINYTLKFPKAHEREKSIFLISDEPACRAGQDT